MAESKEHILIPRYWSEHFYLLLPTLSAGDSIVVQLPAQKLAIDMILTSQKYDVPINTVTIRNWRAANPDALSDECPKCFARMNRGRASSFNVTVCSCSFHHATCPVTNDTTPQYLRHLFAVPGVPHRFDCICGGDELYAKLVEANPIIDTCERLGLSIGYDDG